MQPPPAVPLESVTPFGTIMLAEGVTRDYLLHHQVCPIKWGAPGELQIAAGPSALLDDAIPDLEQVYRCTVTTVPATESDIARQIERLTARPDLGIIPSLEIGEADGVDDRTTDVRDLVNQPPVVRYVNLLVRDAFDACASDIHLEATKSGLQSRLRLDGVLTPAPEPPATLAHAVVSRIKLLAELDIAERRRPQDGRIRVRLESRDLDLRVSTVPTLFGESVVLRLLDRGGRPVSLAELGMSPEIYDGVTWLAARAHGMMLVTGPTGSGKTTTLYSVLQQRDTAAEKILTVEDPVEYELPGITQVPVHRQAGVTFAAALRSILRQDPDVVMLGEMRDSETAEVAVQAAMTGHLVLSTLHTNDALSAIPRLIDLGTPPYLLAVTLEGMLAQRLVRVTCHKCRVAYQPNAEQIRSVLRAAGEQDGDERQEFTRGTGCPACRNTGFSGRVGLFELATVTDEFRDLIARNAPQTALRTVAAQDGTRPLMSDGWAKVSAGITTIEEVLRVAQS
jgi:general secretion pathway protein E